MSKSTYTDNFFISEVKKVYSNTGKRPQMRQFSWSTTAHRRFGSWNKFLRRAGIIHQLDSSEVNEMIRERNLLWREILFFTSESEWYLDQKKIEKIERLRKAMDIIDQELNECSISREERERAK